MRSSNIGWFVACVLSAGCGARSQLDCLGGECRAFRDGSAEPDEGLGSGGASGSRGGPVGVTGMGGRGPSPVEMPIATGGRPTRPPSSAPNEGSVPPPTVTPRAFRCSAGGSLAGSVEITSRAELESLEGCERIDGDLTIHSLATPNLSPLSRLRVVTGTLSLNMSGSLEGLEALESVNNLILEWLDVTTLEPLGSLTSIGNASGTDSGVLFINNSSLRDLTGLGSIQRVNHIGLSDNVRLQTLSGLGVPRHVNEIRLNGNTSLRDISALSPLTSFEVLELTDAAVVSLRGLENVTRASSLVLVDDPVLTDTSGLENLGALQVLFIENVGLTNVAGLSNLRQVKNVVIQGNPVLAELDGLAQLQLLEELSVSDNPNLSHLPEIAAVTVLQQISVTSNARLETGPRFPGVVTANFVTITQNPQLTEVLGFAALRDTRSVDISRNDSLLAVNLGSLTAALTLRIVCNSSLPEASLAPLLELDFGSANIHGNLGSPVPCSPTEQTLEAR